MGLFCLSSLAFLQRGFFLAVVVGFGDLGCCVQLGLALSLVDSRWLIFYIWGSIVYWFLWLLLAFLKHLELPWLGFYTPPSLPPPLPPSLPPSFLIATPQPPHGPTTTTTNSPPNHPTRFAYMKTPSCKCISRQRAIRVLLWPAPPFLCTPRCWRFCRVLCIWDVEEAEKIAFFRLC